MPDLQRRQLELPGPLGGCSLRLPTQAAADAAYWATWASYRGAVAVRAARLGRPFRGEVDARDAQDAREALVQAGVIPERDGPRLADWAREAYDAGPWSKETPHSTLFQYRTERPDAAPAPGWTDSSDASTGSTASDGVGAARRREYGRLLRGLDAATRLHADLGEDGQKTLLAAGGEGAGTFWREVPTSRELRLTNAQWTMALRQRLSLPSPAAQGAQCQLSRLDGTQCNIPLTAALRHASLCEVGPVKMRTHNALVHLIMKAVRRTGGWADQERAVPEWYTREADGTIREAVLDAVIDWPGAGAQLRLDASVRCAHGSHLQGAACTPGVAARDGERAKRRRYGEGVSPLIFEHLGRLGNDGLNTLRRLRQLSKDYGRAAPGGGPPPGINLRRLRVELEAAVLRGGAERALLALGCRASAALGWAAGAGAAQHAGGG